MNSRAQKIRTVADFTLVPAGELQHCLRDFSRWLVRHGRRTAADDCPAPQEFVWQPPQAVAPIGPGTDIRELGLKRATLEAFRQMRIFTLADLAMITVVQASQVVNVGGATLARIRTLLNGAGLDFLPARAPGAPPEVACAVRSRICGRVDNNCEVTQLGLKRGTEKKLVARKICTVGALRMLSLADLESLLSRRERREVFSILRSRGINLLSNPTELQLWRSGLLALEQLAPPPDQASVLELLPWLGTLAHALHRAGVPNVGSLREISSASVLWDMPGIGPYSWTRVRKLFASMARCAEPVIQGERPPQMPGGTAQAGGPAALLRSMH